MKKIYLIITLIIGFNLFSLDHGLISGFEVGYNIFKATQLTLDTNTRQDDQSDSGSIALKMGYRIEGLRIIGTYNNTVKPILIDNYMPIQDNFRIDINYTFKDFKIGFYHYCDHPVITLLDKRKVVSNQAQRAIYISYYKEF